MNLGDWVRWLLVPRLDVQQGCVKNTHWFHWQSLTRSLRRVTAYIVSMHKCLQIAQKLLDFKISWRPFLNSSGQTDNDGKQVFHTNCRFTLFGHNTHSPSWKVSRTWQQRATNDYLHTTCVYKCDDNKKLHTVNVSSAQWVMTNLINTTVSGHHLLSRQNWYKRCWRHHLIKLHINSLTVNTKHLHGKNKDRRSPSRR